MSSRRPLSLALSLINKDFITVSSFCSVGAQCALHYGGMLMDLQELLGREVPDDAPANCQLSLSPRPRPRPLRGGERGEMGGENCGGLYLVSSRRASNLPALVGEGRQGVRGGENCGGLRLVSSRRASALPALVGEGSGAGSVLSCQLRRYYFHLLTPPPTPPLKGWGERGEEIGV